MSSDNNNSIVLPETILTLREVADWLKLAPRQVLRYGVPCVSLGHKTKRFLARDVLAWLDQQRKSHPTQER